ncbi:MAG: choice-of-anchor J domain-containing protein [Ignavibacteria bacterium]|nr:choice-of-anchor J domain-containing protein [Ignavibacteria bacterium]
MFPKLKKPFETDSINSLPNIIYYSDSFNAANDTTSLKNRGYKVFYRGTGPQGLTAAWFQGSSIVFPAFNGSSSGYVAANFNAVTSQNNIDNWLILPSKNIVKGDSLFFFSRSILDSRFPDSIRVMFSQTGDSVPEALWTEAGRFKVNTNGSWQRKGFRAPSTGTKARFAIRYNVVNGGPSGINSDYIGIDSLTLERPIIFPK